MSSTAAILENVKSTKELGNKYHQQGCRRNNNEDLKTAVIILAYMTLKLFHVYAQSSSV